MPLLLQMQLSLRRTERRRAEAEHRRIERRTVERSLLIESCRRKLSKITFFRLGKSAILPS
jgi:hypothetical protein